MVVESMIRREVEFGEMNDNFQWKRKNNYSQNTATMRMSAPKCRAQRENMRTAKSFFSNSAHTTMPSRIGMERPCG